MPFKNVAGSSLQEKGTRTLGVLLSSKLKELPSITSKKKKKEIKATFKILKATKSVQLHSVTFKAR